MEEPFVCSFGVVNCPICMRPRKQKSQAELAKQTKRLTETVTKGLTTGRIKLKIGARGEPRFEGLTSLERGGITDDVIYRNLIASRPSSFVMAQLARAEQLAGRKVDPRVVGHVFGATAVGEAARLQNRS